MAKGPGVRNICCLPPTRAPIQRLKEARHLLATLFCLRWGRGGQDRVGRGAGGARHKPYSWLKCLQWPRQSCMKSPPTQDF